METEERVAEPAFIETEPAWAAPPRSVTEGGSERHVGVELEFTGLTAPDAAIVVAESLGGTVNLQSPHRALVADTALGDVGVELDVKFAHDGDPADPIRRTLSDLSAAVLPIEIVFPPVKLSNLPCVDLVARRLRDAGALGTRRSPFFAFGAQLNPELPELTTDYILRGLQSFILVRDWLRAEIDVDLSRKVWFFAAPFPEDYADLVLAPGYTPTLTGLIDDYLARNPTRNREVDLLPLFAHLDPERVRTALPNETANARPTWHYRLPNALIDDPGWTVALEWERWLVVERLAERPDLIAAHAARRAADRAERRSAEAADLARDVVASL